MKKKSVFQRQRINRIENQLLDLSLKLNQEKEKKRNLCNSGLKNIRFDYISISYDLSNI